MYRFEAAFPVCISLQFEMKKNYGNLCPFAVFWEQQGLQTFGQRIQITRPHASQPAFERHFGHLTEEYGTIHAINLLGTKENEAILSSTYDRHLQIARGVLGDGVSITHFDFHSQVRIGGHDSVMRELRCVDSYLVVLIVR